MHDDNDQAQPGEIVAETDRYIVRAAQPGRPEKLTVELLHDPDKEPPVVFLQQAGSADR